MVYFVAKRLLAAVPVLLGVSILVFSMLHLVPGDPVLTMLSEAASTPEQIETLRTQLHLNEPLPQQFGRFLWGAVHGDLGVSIISKRPVATEIAAVFPLTLELTVAGLFVAGVIGVSLGIFAAIKQYSWLDAGSMFFALFGISMPSFWLGLILIFTFSLHWKLFPATGGGNGDLRHLVLPAVTLGLGEAAVIARLTRTSMLEVLRREYVTVARSKGLREFVVIGRHALKNAFIPVVTMFGLQFGRLLAGTAIVEAVFSRPGVGRLIVSGILSKDFPMVQGIVLLVATGYVVVNLVVDVAYGFLDPRIRQS